MRETIDTPLRKTMPQLNFQNAFATEDWIAPRHVDLGYPVEPAVTVQSSCNGEDFAGRNRPDRITLLLAIFTALGGLTCAIYFFNGAEAIWKIFSSPRESFYGRPAEPMTQNAQLALAQKNVDPRLVSQPTGQSNATSAARSAPSPLQSASSANSNGVASSQSPGTNANSAGLPTATNLVSGAASTINKATSKVATVRKKVTRSTKKVSKVAKKTTDAATKNTAQSATQNSQTTATQMTSSISLHSGFGSGFGSSSGFGGGVGGGIGGGLSGAVGGALGGRR